MSGSYTDGVTHNYWNVSDIQPAIQPLPCDRCERRTVARKGNYCIVCMDRRECYQNEALVRLMDYKRKGTDQTQLTQYHD